MGLFSKKVGLFDRSSTAEQVAAGIDASNLTAIVTGGNTGIGAEVVRVLVSQGAQVVIAARNKAAAEALHDSLKKDHPGASIHCMRLDLASLASVRSFAAEFIASGLPLNVLINNAGVMFLPFSLSADGVEAQFATNHLGHFLLTNLLLDTMKSTASASGIEGRIVNLASVAHESLGYKEGIRDLDKISDPKCYDPRSAYGQSKLANVLHAKSLAEKLKQEGANITANAVHPGLINTGLWKHSSPMKLLLKLVMAGKWKSNGQGAATTVYVALHPDCKGLSGEYFEDCRVSKASKKANDADLAKKLWEISDKLVAASASAAPAAAGTN